MTAVLLDKVAAYAAAVRSHLADLTPEQVDDLTDGLEADLAEAVEDAPAGGVASSADEASMLDLTTRFGPAAEYAAELRAAAGLGSGGVLPRRRPLRDAIRSTGERWRARGASLTRQLAGVPGGAWVVETVPLMRPVWWLLRGWVWFVIVQLPVIVVVGVRDPLVPSNVFAWIVLVSVTVLSVERGRGRLDGRPPLRGVLVVANVVAVLAVVPLVNTVVDHARPEPVYIESGSPYVEQPHDGVIVDGMYVSNLFVYDAEGNPLRDVQIVDDRGRQVRTIDPESGQEWSLPGVSERWAFASSPDVDGRERWNVYPLLGAPFDDWAWTESGEWELAGGSVLKTPPYPFAKAPALRGVVGTTTLPSAAPTDGAETETTPSATAPAGSDPSGTGTAETAPSGSTG